MPTWVEYMRLHSRTTHEDAPIGDRIRALHSGTEPPRVRRLLVRTTTRRRAEPTARTPLDIHLE